MRESLLKEKVDLTMPRTFLQVHERAEPNESAANPRVGLQLAIGALAGMVLALPGGLILAYIVPAVRGA